MCSSRRERLLCLSGQTYEGLELANCPEWGAEEKEDEHSEKGTKREPSPQPLEWDILLPEGNNSDFSATFEGHVSSG